MSGRGIRVSLSPREHDLLAALTDQLRPILSGEHDIAGAHARLYPPAYEEADHEAEYREMVGDGLVGERLAALEAFARTLAGGTTTRRGWSVDLSDQDAAAWLSATNDARLTLAAVVGITSEEQWESGPSEENPAGVALWYLGWLQEELLVALTATL